MSKTVTNRTRAQVLELERTVAALRALVKELKKKGRAVMVLDDLPPPYECDGPCPQHEFLGTLILTEDDMQKRLEEQP